jgi:hypothetical protein
VVGAGIEPTQRKTGRLQLLGLTNAQPHHKDDGSVGASITLALGVEGKHWTQLSCAPKAHAGQIPDVRLGGAFFELPEPRND